MFHKNGKLSMFRVKRTILDQLTLCLCRIYDGDIISVP